MRARYCCHHRHCHCYCYCHHTTRRHHHACYHCWRAQLHVARHATSVQSSQLPQCTLEPPHHTTQRSNTALLMLAAGAPPAAARLTRHISLVRRVVQHGDTPSCLEALLVSQSVSHSINPVGRSPLGCVDIVGATATAARLIPACCHPVLCCVQCLLLSSGDVEYVSSLKIRSSKRSASAAVGVAELAGPLAYAGHVSKAARLVGRSAAGALWTAGSFLLSRVSSPTVRYDVAARADRSQSSRLQ